MKSIALLLLTPWLVTAQLPDRFIRALHLVETGGRLGPVRGDQGRALGPLQIHRAYWHDAVQHDKSLGGRYEDVADLRYAVLIVDAYMRRYAPAAYRRRDLQTMARVHNGGPSGHRKQSTLRYWSKLQVYLR